MKFVLKYITEVFQLRFTDVRAPNLQATQPDNGSMKGALSGVIAN